MLVNKENKERKRKGVERLYLSILEVIGEGYREMWMNYNRWRAEILPKKKGKDIIEWVEFFEVLEIVINKWKVEYIERVLKRYIRYIVYKTVKGCKE